MSRKTVLAFRPQGGYVLVMVLASLAVVALVAMRFAARIDSLRSSSLSWGAYAAGQVDAASAQHAALYWVATRRPGLAAFGEAPQGEVRADGRPYLLPSGAEVRIQDVRGLYPLNMTASRVILTRLLQNLGAKQGREDALVDVLFDYEDVDSLKRLQGAEADEYRRMSLRPPRNDYLLTTSELEHLPVWRDELQFARRVADAGSTSRELMINPNTVPLPLLKALAPSGRPEQFELFLTLRSNVPFAGAASVLSATGLSLPEDAVWFHVGESVRLSVWAPGLPSALQYNVTFDLNGRIAAWHVTDLQPVPRQKSTDADTVRPAPFPMALKAIRP